MLEKRDLDEIVKETLEQLRQATTQQVFKQAKSIDPTATLHKVRKILEEGGFAERGFGKVTITRKDSTYEKHAQVWIYKGQKPREAAKVPVAVPPSVEVLILPRRARIPYRVIEEIEHGTPKDVEYQALEVTVRNATVHDLQVKLFLNDGGIWFDGKNPFYLSWGHTRALDFYPNQTDRIEFWLAYRIGDVEKLLLNFWGRPVILALKEIYQRNQPYIDVGIQFIGEGLNEQIRNYRLNAQCWDKINLTEQPLWA
jgi:hypothetical protein